MGLFEDSRVMMERIRWVQVFFAVVFAILLGRLWYLTAVQSERYQELARRSHVRQIPLPAARGIIYDREGRVLVDNVQSADLVLYRDEVKDLDKTESFLTKGLKLTSEDFRSRLGKLKKYPRYQPLVIKENLSIDETAYIMAHRVNHPEVGILRQPRRIYRYGPLAAHALGYVGEVTSEQLDDEEYEKFELGDIIGQYGLERTYNTLLAGTNGRQRVLVDSHGRNMGDLQSVQPITGRPLRLTLDLDLQQVAEQELAQDPGAVVAVDPRTGDVLVMASSPSFDPNHFAVRITSDEWSALTADPDHPLQNRSIQSTFSPGSVFKVVMALAGLESGIVSPSRQFHCSGGAYFYGRYFRCWKEGGHGAVTLQRAVQHSCNVYFYHLGQALGISRISDFSEKVGLGVPTGIDLTGEITGVVPSEAWKQRLFGVRWFPGETISVSIGQGAMTVTPIQLAQAVGAIATGKLPRLHLAKQPPAPGLGESGPLELDFGRPNLEVVRDGMARVVSAGTGRAASVADFEVCGKTGTAQTIGRQALAKLSREEARRFEPNAWFVAFAPRHDPEIVVTVIVQRGGSGGAVAAPIAGKVLERYYQKHYQPGQQSPLDVALQSRQGRNESTVHSTN